MAFVNEFVSEQDIEKYDLDDLLNSYEPYSLNRLPHPGFKHTWTVDRERGIHFLPVKTVEKVGPSGRNEPTGRRIFVLRWDGTNIEIQLEKTRESTAKFSTVPFRIVWELIDISPPELANASHEEVLQVLREALLAFGADGVNWQVPNTIVEFKF